MYVDGTPVLYMVIRPEELGITTLVNTKHTILCCESSHLHTNKIKEITFCYREVANYMPVSVVNRLLTLWLVVSVSCSNPWLLH
jgi:hypothetical protein